MARVMLELSATMIDQKMQHADKTGTAFRVESTCSKEDWNGVKWALVLDYHPQNPGHVALRIRPDKAPATRTKCEMLHVQSGHFRDFQIASMWDAMVLHGFQKFMSRDELLAHELVQLVAQVYPDLEH